MSRDRGSGVKANVIVAISVLAVVVAAISGTVSAMVVRSHDMERVATLEAQVTALHETDKRIEGHLERIEDKIDTLLFQKRLRSGGE